MAFSFLAAGRDKLASLAKSVLSGGIVDGGATKTVAGTVWLSRYEKHCQKANLVGAEGFESKSCSVLFTFGGGEQLLAKKVYKVPALTEDGENFDTLWVHAVESALPLLIGRDALHDWGAAEDYGGGHLNLFGGECQVELHELESGHRALDLFQRLA